MPKGLLVHKVQVKDAVMLWMLKKANPLCIWMPFWRALLWEQNEPEIIIIVIFFFFPGKKQLGPEVESMMKMDLRNSREIGY